jgi:hypothetical protein
MLARRRILAEDVTPANRVLTICWRLFGAYEEPLSDGEIAAAERELGVTLPPSYRTFLRYYASATARAVEFFGLPRDRLCRDVVLVNQANPRLLSLSLLKVARDGAGRGYYLDLARMNEDGECPVLSHAYGWDACYVADNFLQFLTLVNADLLAPVWSGATRGGEGGYGVRSHLGLVGRTNAR